MRSTLLLLALLSCAGCIPVKLQQAPAIHARVLEMDGSPLANCKVHLTGIDQEVVTGSDGAFTSKEVSRLAWIVPDVGPFDHVTAVQAQVGDCLSNESISLHQKELFFLDIFPPPQTVADFHLPVRP